MSVTVVAPAIATPFLVHWKTGDGLPSALAVNVTRVPTIAFS
jgi:hypothetical protein